MFPPKQKHLLPLHLHNSWGRKQTGFPSWKLSHYLNSEWYVLFVNAAFCTCQKPWQRYQTTNLSILVDLVACVSGLSKYVSRSKFNTEGQTMQASYTIIHSFVLTSNYYIILVLKLEGKSSWTFPTQSAARSGQVSMASMTANLSIVWSHKNIFSFLPFTLTRKLIWPDR